MGDSKRAGKRGETAMYDENKTSEQKSPGEHKGASRSERSKGNSYQYSEDTAEGDGEVRLRRGVHVFLRTENVDAVMEAEARETSAFQEKCRCGMTVCSDAEQCVGGDACGRCQREEREGKP